MPQRVFEIKAEDLRGAAPQLRAGDRILLSGGVFTARDAAHKAMFRQLEGGGALPFDARGAIIYYTGPTPAKGGMAVGSCGPTTSGRMDAFTPMLYDMGLAATIGKGERSDAVRASIVKNRAVYLCAVGGAGALIARCVTSAEEIAYGELGCESIKLLTVENLPLTVAIDSAGADVFARH
ncbi:MAG: FumA C-terminus/TtdB family hydratase beta subunit [Oscillospiraceae bacterium]|jgi:fumarate hydratase subunit beta|nr:FumA C-terminus/TtdB family hydratase beta subunit [Oscillospiraceae bacterium]